MKSSYFIFFLAASIVLGSCNRGGTDSNVNEERNEAAAESNTDKFAGRKQRDAEFVYETVASTYGEIKLAEVANQRSRTAEIKKIAQVLLTDHTASLNELKTLAQAKAISVPVEEPDASKRQLEIMAGETGEAFDQKWCREMMDLHEKSIDSFEKGLDNTEDAELRSFISKTLPVLKAHHSELKALDEALEKKKR